LHYQWQEYEGHPTRAQRLEWHNAHSPHSFAYDNHVLLQFVNPTVEDVSLKEEHLYDCVLVALERRIEEGLIGRFRDGGMNIFAVRPDRKKL
jgi:hypothetical protein